MSSYTASRISANHNILFPDRIEINDDRVIYYKGALIGYQTTFIARDRISSVRLITNVLFADLIIESSGGRKIEVNGLSKKDARHAYDLLRR